MLKKINLIHPVLLNILGIINVRLTGIKLLSLPVTAVVFSAQLVSVPGLNVKHVSSALAFCRGHCYNCSKMLRR